MNTQNSSNYGLYQTQEKLEIVDQEDNFQGQGFLFNGECEMNEVNQYLNLDFQNANNNNNIQSSSCLPKIEENFFDYKQEDQSVRQQEFIPQYLNDYQKFEVNSQNNNAQIQNASQNQYYQQQILQHQIINQELKMLEKSKRIAKREKAKIRKKALDSINKQIQEHLLIAPNSPLSSSDNQNNQFSDSKSVQSSANSQVSTQTEGTEDKSDKGKKSKKKGTGVSNNLNFEIPEGLDQKQKKKMQQMIRNRISAQNSRDRKKAYIDKLETQNENYRLQIEKLHQQTQILQGSNQQLIKENEDLKQRIRNPKNLVCNNCGRSDFTVREDLFGDPEIQPKQSRGSLAFGLGLFALVSIVMLLGSLGNSNTGVTLFSNGDKEFQSLIAERDRIIVKSEDMQLNNKQLIELDQQSECYLLAKELEFMRSNPPVQLLENQSIQILKIEEEQQTQIQSEQNQLVFQDEQIDNQNGIIEIDRLPANKRKQNNLRNNIQKCEDEKQISQLQYPEIQTIYCPKPYRFFDSNNVGESFKINIQNNEWIQLILPKKEIRTLLQNNGKMYLQSEDNEDENKLVEIWAKISSIRESDMMFKYLDFERKQIAQ